MSKLDYIVYQEGRKEGKMKLWTCKMSSQNQKDGMKFRKKIKLIFISFTYGEPKMLLDFRW